ncbi:hypothetical protein HWV62_27261 [Athelia sp. TMB]|nr:hypothetical protein HWV62_27261 [Athelia sp. TMB]
MSNDIQKADQIAYRLFTKLTLVVHQARATVDQQQRQQPKIDKWFNLETPDTDLYRDQLRIYRSISAPRPPQTPPPLELQVLLVIPELANNQVLVYQAPDASRVAVDPAPRFILLEKWLLAFTPAITSSKESSEGDVAPSTIYKHGIPLFRSLFTLLRVLPTWRLFKRLRRGARNANLGIQIRVRERKEHVSASAELSSNESETEESDDADGREGILGFDTPPTRTREPLLTSTHGFPSIPHPMGTLALSARYLTTPNFSIDDRENVLSDRFLHADIDDIDMDMLRGGGAGAGGRGFTPTLVKNQQRDSMLATGGASHGSPSTRMTPLARSPPRTSFQPATSPIARYPPLPSNPATNTSPTAATTQGRQSTIEVLADRFVLPSPTATPATSPYTSPAASTVVPRHTRTTSLPQAPSLNLRQRALSRSPRGGNANLPLPGLPGPSSVARASSNTTPLPTVGSMSSDTGSIGIRVRKESGSASSASPGSHLPNLPEVPTAGALPIRRPGLNPVHPFKASTLSSSPSLHSPTPSSLQSRIGAPSPLAASPRPFPTSGATSPTSARIPVPPSPMRPSPPPQNPNSPFAPSSLGDDPGRPGQRKRYSSSFAKRYDQKVGAAGTGTPLAIGSPGAGGSGGSDGSAEIGSLGIGLGQGPVGRFLAPGGATDDDDISMYLQDIDARKPLSGRGLRHGRARTEIGKADEGVEEEVRDRREEDRPPIPGLLSTEETTPVGEPSAGGAMLTSESEVEERLRQMNQAFLQSLEGLGSSSSGSGNSNTVIGRGQSASPGLSDVRGRGFRPRLGELDLASRSTSTSDAIRGSGGSDEVLGRMSFDSDKRSRQ